MITLKDQLETLIVTHTVEMAKSLLEEHGYRMRIWYIDGECLTIKCDAQQNRVNVEVKDDKIIAIRSIG